MQTLNVNTDSKILNGAGVVVLLAVAFLNGHLYARWSMSEKVDGIGYDSLRASEFSACLSEDRYILYFSAADLMGEKHLFRAQRLKPYGSFDTVEQILDFGTGLQVCDPWLSHDGETLFYSREIVSGGDMVICRAQWDHAQSKWVELEVLEGIHISGSNDLCPSLTKDLLHLYFASDRNRTAGQLSLWAASRSSTSEPFANIQLVSISASHAECAYPGISADGSTIYYSARDSSGSDWQLWSGVSDGPGQPFLTRSLAFSSTQYDETHPCIVPDGDMLLYSDENGLWSIKRHTKLHVDATSGNDSNHGTACFDAYKTIQKAVEEAENGDTVLIWPGEYSETVDFLGKAVTVKGASEAPVITSPGGVAVWFFHGEGPDSSISNCVIKGSSYGVFCLSASPDIRNLTIAGNECGIWAGEGADPLVENCISWSNNGVDVYGADCGYSCTETEVPGEANIRENPLFADPARGDYHVQSEAGRFQPADPNTAGWQTPVLLSELNDVYGNSASAPFFTDDVLEVYFSRYDPGSGYSSIFQASRPSKDVPFSNEQNLMKTGDIGEKGYSPWVSADNLRLYFCVASESGLGELRMAVRQQVGDTWTLGRTFSELNAGNTPVSGVSLTADELTVVFHTRGEGTDLYTATRPSRDANFSHIRPLEELNTFANELSPCISPDGLNIYYNSNESVYYRHSIYRASRASIYEPFSHITRIEFPEWLDFSATACHINSSQTTLWFTITNGIWQTDFNSGNWVQDALTSPCIDAGSFRDNPTAELYPNGGWVNMGAYGGTAYASKSLQACWSEYDLNCDGVVNWQDHRAYGGGQLAEIEAFASEWLQKAPWYK